MTTHHNRNHQSTAPIDSMDANLFHIEETNKLLSNLETKISNLVSTKNPTSSINQSSNETEPTPYHNRPNPYKNESRAPYTLTSSPQNFKGVRRSITAGYDNSSQNEKGHINVVEDHNEEIPKSHIYSSPAHISSLYGASPIKNDDFHEISRHDFKNSFKLRDEESQNDRSGFIREPMETFGVAQREDRMENIREAMRQRNLKRSRDGFLDKMGQMEKFYKEKVDILEEKLLVYEDELKGNTRLFEDLNREIDRLKADLEDSKRAKRAHEDIEAKWTKKEQEWNVERKNLEKEGEQVKKSFKETTTEKEELEKRYEGLLKVQREMVQLDMEKNEKHLKSSAAKTEERNIIENEKILGLMDMIEQYKQEVEFLKENNNLLRKQLGFEIEQLKEELVDQKMENRRLSRRAKNESMNSTMSGESKREGSKKREEEGKGTAVKESGNYVKEWGNYYPQGEGKGLKSSAHHRVKSSLSKRNEEGIRRFEEREDGGSGNYEGRVGIRREKKHGDVKSIS